MTDLALQVPEDLLDEIARRAAAIVAAERTTAAPEPWLDVDGAARHLGYADNLARGRRRVFDLNAGAPSNGWPVHHDGRRCIYRASEIDAYLEGAR